MERKPGTISGAFLLTLAVIVFAGIAAAHSVDDSDGFSTTPANKITSSWGGGGDGIWRRNAVFSEGVTFDPCNAHQPPSGEYHYHDDPVCLRYQLGDNITGANVGTAEASFSENTSNLKHSPILGWAFDGYPVYGPYGYSKAMDSTSTIRRMVSSFSLRNMTERHKLPKWAAAAQGISATLTRSQYGPAVSSTYALGRYVEDYTYVAGAGDLDQYNGRHCVTPEFPNGTYAYFVTIDSDGQPAFPYVIGAQFYGTVSGGEVSSVTESTTTYFDDHALQSSSSSAPQVVSWFLQNTAQDAEILDELDLSAGPVSTWFGNPSPTYADVQEIQYSSDYVYVSMSGMASHLMGPWYLDAGRTEPFPNYPRDQNAISKLPLTQTVARKKTATGGGAQGRWVNGVAMFNMLDFFSWSNSEKTDVGPGAM
jgi:hypothetical protein